MTKWLLELLSEKGALSTTRVVQVVGLIMAFILAIIGIVKGDDLVGIAILCLSFIAPQTVAKVMQKKVESTKVSKK